MAFGQKATHAPHSWGDAPGYGKNGLRPKMKIESATPKDRAGSGAVLRRFLGVDGGAVDGAVVGQGCYAARADKPPMAPRGMIDPIPLLGMVKMTAG